MTDKGNNFFLRLFFQSSLHLGKDLVVGVMHDADALFRAIRSTQAAALAKRLENFGVFIFVHFNGIVRTSLGTQTALIAIRQIDVGHNAFGFDVAFFHGDGCFHGRPDPFFTAFFESHGRFGTAGQGNPIGGKFQWAEFDVGFLEEAIRIAGYF